MQPVRNAPVDINLRVLRGNIKGFFEFDKCLVEIFLLGVGDPKVTVSSGDAVIECDNLCEVSDCFFVLVLIKVNCAALVVRLC